jgi:hypothetical protein
MITMTKFQKSLLILALVAARLPTLGAQPVAGNPNMPRTITITGTVYDPNGAPAAGVVMDALSFYTQAKRSVLTDANGKYWLDWMTRPPNAVSDGKLIESVIARDIQRNLVATRLIDEGLPHADLHLQPGLTISFKVEDPAGHPVTNAEARLNISYANASLSIVNQPPAGNTTEQNCLEFRALPPGFHYVGYVQAIGTGSAMLPIPAETHTNRLDLGTITLKADNLKIAGRVLGPDGKAVGRMMVILYGEARQATMVQADDDGRFAYDGCAGPVTVSAFSILNAQDGPRLTGMVQTIGGDTNIEIKLTPVKESKANESTPANAPPQTLPGG